jgi:hypothetical protein
VVAKREVVAVKVEGKGWEWRKQRSSSSIEFLTNNEGEVGKKSVNTSTETDGLGRRY